MLHYLWDAACIAIGFLLIRPSWLANRKRKILITNHEVEAEKRITEEKWRISIIIPARNEAENLTILLPLLKQQSLLPYEIIVVDDGSVDDTSRIAGELGAAVCQAPPLPQGWIGKSWACWQGANRAHGEWFIFLDADTRPTPSFIEQMYAQLLETNGLITVQPLHNAPSFREQSSAFFNLVITAGSGARGIFSSGTDGFGPCAACSREQYYAIGGHDAVRSEMLEHLQLGRHFIAAGLPSILLLGRRMLEFRMYPKGWLSLIQGWSKSIGLGAGSTKPATLMLVILWFSGLAAAAIRLLQLTGDAGETEWILVIAMYSFAVVTVSRGLFFSGTFRWYTKLFYPIYLLFFATMFIYSIAISFILRRVSWKGRRIDVP